MYIGTSINESPVITGKASAAIPAAAMLAAAMDADGVTVAGDGAPAVGLIIAETDDVAAGDDVTIQVKDIGLWKVGAAVAPGALLASDANGKAITAAAGKFIVAQALEAATAADQIIHVQVIKAGYAT